MQSLLLSPTESEFKLFQSWINSELGIYLPPHKITLLNRRLGKRVSERNCRSYREYFSLINQAGEQEEQYIALELITTNETYFFREIKHFDFLRDEILPEFKGGNFKAWSAACSNGAEPYSLAMVLDQGCSTNWHIEASDVNRKILEKARVGIYPMTELEKIPTHFRHQYCREGKGEYAGFFRISPELRREINFECVNLNQNLPFKNAEFHLILLRNVMIYFNKDVQTRLVTQIEKQLRPGGWLFLGHAESLQGIPHNLKMLKPAIYQKV